MHRRSFIQKSAIAAVSLSFFPAFAHRSSKEYTTNELIGKADLPLFGKGKVQLLEPAFEAYELMRKAAQKDGITFQMVSSYRSFFRQRDIWEKKYSRYTNQNMSSIKAIEKIIEYSTIPGTSRHHWGTEIDIVDSKPKVSGSVLDPKKFDNGQPYGPLKEWLDENSEKFGFFLVYTDSYFRKGFKYEPWHYSYAPLSIPMLKQFRLKNIAKIVQSQDFHGVEHLSTRFLDTYIQDNILDINPALL